MYVDGNITIAELRSSSKTNESATFATTAKCAASTAT